MVNMTDVKKPSGRPKKADHEKIQYQRIAVYAQDYLELVAKVAKKNSTLVAGEKKIQITDAFSEMVKKYH